MPNIKLTLSVPAGGIERAKRYARAHHTSVSGLVSRFFNSLGERGGQGKESITESALGMVKLPKRKTDRELLDDALSDKILK